MWENEESYLLKEMNFKPKEEVSSLTAKSIYKNTTPINSFQCRTSKNINKMGARRYTSCILQLKEHISYINVSLTNSIDELDTLRANLNENLKTIGGELIENSRIKFDMEANKIIKTLNELLFNNIDTIEQFSNVITEVSYTSIKQTASPFSEGCSEFLPKK